MYKLKVIKKYGGHYRLEIASHICHVCDTAQKMIEYINRNWQGERVAWIILP